MVLLRDLCRVKLDPDSRRERSRSAEQAHARNAFFCSSVPVASRRSHVSRLTHAHTSVGVPMFELGAAGEGRMDGNALLVPHLIGRQTVRSERRDVEMQGSVRLQLRQARTRGLL